MSNSKEKKTSIGLMVLTLICTAISLVDLLYYADFFIDGKGLYSLFVAILEILPLIVLILYIVKPSFKKTNTILIFLILKICSRLIYFGRDVYLILNNVYDTSMILSSLIALIVCILLYVFMIVDVTKGNKKIAYITLSFLICMFLLSLVNASRYIMNANNYSGTDILLNGIQGLMDALLVLWFWFTKITKKIIFKEKIKFDYKPIQKKVAVTETTLEELKLMYDNGTITEQEYNHKKSEIINKL